MTDALGWRAKFGVLGPSTNTIVQPEFDDMRVPGVTNHYSRIVIENADAVSDETFMTGTLEINAHLLEAVRGVLTCAPDYLVMGMSAVTFYDGAEGASRWKQRVIDQAGIGISIGSESVAEACKAIGGIRNVAVLSPYYPVANREVIRFLADHGIHTVRDTCLRCRSWTGNRRGGGNNHPRGGGGTKRGRCRRYRAGRNESLHVAPSCNARNGTRKAGHRHQRGHLLACAADQRHRRPPRRFRKIIRAALRTSYQPPKPVQMPQSATRVAACFE